MECWTLVTVPLHSQYKVCCTFCNITSWIYVTLLLLTHSDVSSRPGIAGSLGKLGVHTTNDHCVERRCWWCICVDEPASTDGVTRDTPPVLELRTCSLSLTCHELKPAQTSSTLLPTVAVYFLHIHHTFTLPIMPEHHTFTTILTTTIVSACSKIFLNLLNLVLLNMSTNSHPCHFHHTVLLKVLTFDGTFCSVQSVCWVQ